MSFDDIKTFNGTKYSGMTVGGSHHWIYPNGEWKETKIAPDTWEIAFSSMKHRKVPAPDGSGVPLRTAYHWGIISDQKVLKVSANEYETIMSGLKYKIGHKRPHWRDFSYRYKGQPTYRQRVIEILKNTLERLEAEEQRERGGLVEAATGLISAMSLVQSQSPNAPNVQKLQ
jgi:hypothetical protein